MASLDGRVDKLAYLLGPTCPNCHSPLAEAGPPPKWGEDPQHDRAQAAAEAAYIRELEADYGRQR